MCMRVSHAHTFTVQTWPQRQVIIYWMNLGKLYVLVFWIMMSLINWVPPFGGTCCWHLQGRRISYKDEGVSCNHWYRFYGTSYRNPVEQRSQSLWNGTRAHSCSLRFRCHFAAVLTAALSVALFWSWHLSLMLLNTPWSCVPVVPVSCRLFFK